MLKNLFRLRFPPLQAAEQPRPGDGAERWREDPLSHPAIAAMDMRELGDLPCGARAGHC